MKIFPNCTTCLESKLKTAIVSMVTYVRTEKYNSIIQKPEMKGDPICYSVCVLHCWLEFSLPYQTPKQNVGCSEMVDYNVASYSSIALNMYIIDQIIICWYELSTCK